MASTSTKYHVPFCKESNKGIPTIWPANIYYHSTVGLSVEEEHFAIVPASVGIVDPGQDQAGLAVLASRFDLGHAPLVLRGRVLRVVVVPNIKWNLSALGK